MRRLKVKADMKREVVVVKDRGDFNFLIELTPALARQIAERLIDRADRIECQSHAELPRVE